MKLFPNNTMTVSGAAGAIVTPIVGTLLSGAGIGECTVEQLQANPGCVGSAQLGAALVTVLFGFIAWRGRVRAQRRHEAELAAATSPPAVAP